MQQHFRFLPEIIAAEIHLASNLIKKEGIIAPSRTQNYIILVSNYQEHRQVFYCKLCSKIASYTVFRAETKEQIWDIPDFAVELYPLDTYLNGLTQCRCIYLIII